MTFTYKQQPIDNILDEIRFLIGDTVEEKHLIEDEDIAYALHDASNNIKLACAVLCDGIAAKFAREADVRVTSYATDRRTIFEKYKQMAAEFRAAAVVNISGMVGAAYFVCPSISVSEKEAIEDDDSLTKPSFKRGLFDYADDPDLIEDEL